MPWSEPSHLLHQPHLFQLNNHHHPPRNISIRRCRNRLVAMKTTRCRSKKSTQVCQRTLRFAPRALILEGDPLHTSFRLKIRSLESCRKKLRNCCSTSRVTRMFSTIWGLDWLNDSGSTFRSFRTSKHPSVSSRNTKNYLPNHHQPHRSIPRLRLLQSSLLLFLQLPRSLWASLSLNRIAIERYFVHSAIRLLLIIIISEPNRTLPHPQCFTGSCSLLFLNHIIFASFIFVFSLFRLVSVCVLCCLLLFLGSGEKKIKNGFGRDSTHTKNRGWRGNKQLGLELFQLFRSERRAATSIPCSRREQIHKKSWWTGSRKPRKSQLWGQICQEVSSSADRQEARNADGRSGTQLIVFITD